MTTSVTAHRPSPLQAWIVRLLLTAFVLRAFVPTGYMPDFQAAARGVFKVVICTASGPAAVQLDSDGNPVPAPSGNHDGQPCAFAGLLTLTGEADLSAQPVELVTFATSLETAPVARIDVAILGPPLGSRAPPA